MKNNIIELAVNIEYYPYCGSKNIIRENESCTCNVCGRFIVSRVLLDFREAIYGL